MKTELKELQQFKSYFGIKIFTKIGAIFQNFNELEGPLRRFGFVSNQILGPPNLVIVGPQKRRTPKKDNPKIETV